MLWREILKTVGPLIKPSISEKSIRSVMGLCMFCFVVPFLKLLTSNVLYIFCNTATTVVATNDKFFLRLDWLNTVNEVYNCIQ